MVKTFAELSPETEDTVDVSVIPDTGNNIDLAAIVQRIDDMAAQIKALTDKVNGCTAETAETTKTTETTETTETDKESDT